MSLELQTKHLPPDIVIVEMKGRITQGPDATQIQTTAKALAEEQQKKVIFDLGGVTHIDSTGIGTLVIAATLIRDAGGQLRLTGCSERVEHLLKVTNLAPMLGLYPTTEAAAAAF